jgi:AraC family transcriptional regulator
MGSVQCSDTKKGGVLVEGLLLESSCRLSTLDSHALAVERVIRAMLERLDDPLSLQDMATMACLSPYHFTHVFHRITGIAPREFLAALRLEAAKRLLLTTTRSITEICFDMGYSSLGTFTKRFTRLVGLPPSRLRELAEQFTLPPVDLLPDYYMDQEGLAHVSVSGYLHVPADFKGLIFVGLFSSPLPQSRPLGCTLMTRGDTYAIPCMPNGRYYLFAAAFVWPQDPLAYLLSHTSLRACLNQRPVSVCEGQISGSTDVSLRPTRMTDPPILIALPLLLVGHLAAEALVPV